MSNNDGCAAIREAVSADLDGEVAPVSHVEVARHLRGCAACERFVGELSVLARRTRLGAADRVPDLSGSITARLAGASTPPSKPARSARRQRDLRALVALAGVAQLIVAAPMLLGLLGPDLHLGRDLGAAQVAIGVGLVFAAAQPRRAPGLLPVVAVVAAITVVAATIDVVTGAASLAAELTHLAELVGVAALWALSRHLPPQPSPSASPPRLRVEAV